MATSRVDGVRRQKDAATPPFSLNELPELRQRDRLREKQSHDPEQDHVDLLAEFFDLLALAE